MNVIPPSVVTRGAPAEVALPSDESTLEGQFQVRCRDLITEIRTLAFDPFVWVGLINDLGAVGAAKRILGDPTILPVTHWLVDRGLSELTMEFEVQQAKWAGLFDDGDRNEAARRLVLLGRPDRNG